jgi:ABC-type glycerol-3-phosphate transport system substrate-binding protein
MDRRLQKLAEQLDAGVIARREFLRTSALITGGTAAGLHVMNRMAHAQSGTKLRVWLFKSFVTASNDVLAKQIEAWGAERKVQVEMDWATFGDREQKFVAAIEAGNPPDLAEMNYLGPMRYRPALQDVTALSKDIAGARGGLLPHAERYVVFGGQHMAVARTSWPGGFFVRKDLLEAKGIKMPKVYDPDVVDMAKKTQDPAKDLWGFGQTLNRSDDGNGFMQNILWGYGGSAWDKEGKPALATSFLKQNLEALQFAVDII